MKKNMGTVDRVVRILAALAVGAAWLGGYLSGTWAIVLGVVAVVFVITSFAGHCPGYVPIGFDTTGRKGAGTPGGGA